MTIFSQPNFCVVSFNAIAHHHKNVSWICSTFADIKPVTVAMITNLHAALTLKYAHDIMRAHIECTL